MFAQEIGIDKQATQQTTASKIDRECENHVS